MAAAEGMMRAVQYSTYGGGPQAFEHVKIPIPTPKAGEILVKVESAGVNPVDWKIQKGELRPILPPCFPYIPGTDIAGEVIALGPGVDNFSPGDKVVSWLDIRRGGSLSEFAIAPIRSTVKRPPEVSAIDGSCLPVAGFTAIQSLRDNAGVKFGEENNLNLLITAASGGVGLYVLQVAKLAAGVHVTVTCGARNIDLVKRLGADEVLDYRTPEGDTLRSPSGRLYDAVVHCTTGIPWSKFEPNLKPSCKVIELTPSIKSMAMSALKKIAFCHQELIPFIIRPNTNDLAFLVQLVQDGKLRTMIDSQYPFSKAGDAWARSIDGHATGKIVVTFIE